MQQRRLAVSARAYEGKEKEICDAQPSVYCNNRSSSSGDTRTAFITDISISRRGTTFHSCKTVYMGHTYGKNAENEQAKGEALAANEIRLRRDNWVLEERNA